MVSLRVYGPRRPVLDKILVDAATGAGAELREAFTVTELLWEEDRLPAFVGTPAVAPLPTSRPEIVVGADGVHSLVARAVQAPVYNEKPTSTCWDDSYWSGVPVDGTELYPRDGLLIPVVPTNDGLTAVGVVWPRDEFHAVRANIEGNFLNALAVAPSLADRFAAASARSGSWARPTFPITSAGHMVPAGPWWAMPGITRTPSRRRG